MAYRIVTNVCLDHLRRRQARLKIKPRKCTLPITKKAHGFFERQKEQRPSSDPERHLIGQEIKRGLPPLWSGCRSRAHRFEMKHYQGLKLRAIGDALGTSEETVKNSLSGPLGNSAASWENSDDIR